MIIRNCGITAGGSLKLELGKDADDATVPADVASPEDLHTSGISTSTLKQK